MDVRPFEREERHYEPGLRVRALTFLSDTEIELAFEGIGTEGRTFRARLVEWVTTRSGAADDSANRTADPYSGLRVVVLDWDPEFNRLYRRLPDRTAAASRRCRAAKGC